MKKVILLFVGLTRASMYAQTSDSTSIFQIKNVNFSGYVEIYAAADNPFSKSHERPDFLYNNTRTNELALNLGMMKAAWTEEKVRGNLALMTGTYAGRNLSTEPEVFRNVYEANVGLRLSTDSRIWLDMGVMNSHLGMESAKGMDNPTLTRSMAAENSPYYETGLKLSVQSKNTKSNFSFLILNGWQRIQMPAGNYLPALGLQVGYQPNKKIQINYGNYLGDVNSTHDFTARLFQDLSIVYNPTKSLSLIGAFDVGLQGDLNFDKLQDQLWYTWFGIVRCRLMEKFFIAARVEQYRDENEIIINNYWSPEFNTFAYSLNLDYSIYKNVMLRVEARHFEGETKSFDGNDAFGRHNYSGLTASLSMTF